MSIIVPYIVVVFFSILASFSSLSRGSFFTDAVQGIITLISFIVLISMCVASTILFSWIHIILLFATFVITAWISAFLLKTTLFKHLP